MPSRRHAPHRTVALTLALVAVGVSLAWATGAPGPVSPIVPMNDGTFDGWQDLGACRLSDQTIVRVGSEWVGPYDPSLKPWQQPHHLVLRRYDSGNVPLGDPVVVDATATWRVYGSLRCRPSQGFVVLWRSYPYSPAPLQGRWYDESLNPKAAKVDLTNAEACDESRAALGEGLQLVTACAAPATEGDDAAAKVTVSVFADGGEPIGPAPLSFALDVALDDLFFQGLGIDDASNALLVWETPSSIDARVIGDLADGGSLLGDAFPLFTPGSASDGMAVDSPLPGLFRARRGGDWSGETGGWTGRWISLDGEWPNDDPQWTPNEVLAANTFFERDDPFFTSAPWGYDVGPRSRRPSLAAAAGRVALAWRGTGAPAPHVAPFAGAMVAVSGSEGRAWSTPLLLSERYSPGAPDIAGDGTRWVAAWVTENEYLYEVHAARISLDGSTSVTTLLDSVGDCGDCEDEHQLFGASVATDGKGTWVVAWNVDGAVRVARSTDGGDTWSAPSSVWSSEGRRGLDLVADAHGDFALLSAGLTVGFTRSTDGGLTWNEPARLAEASFPPLPLWLQFDSEELEDHVRYDTQRAYGSGVQLLVVGTDSLLATFALPGTDPEDYGYDSDVLVARSDDNGATWSTPSPIAAYFSVDESTDDWPALASDGASRVVASWRSFDPGAGELGLDADLFGATSQDGGSTWSEPFLVNASASGDSAGDSPAGLVHTGAGTWLAAWQTFEPTGDLESPTWRTVLRVASAGLACGDSSVDPGEECDDGNTADLDGCTSRCLLPACGNGVVEEGEECDDANLAPHDDCTEDCRLSVCGDGTVQTASEECDDANSSNSDGCLTDCRLARCTDGFLHEGVEICDDGNKDYTDACLNHCEPSYCGDGAVRSGVEECDDHDLDGTDGCLSDCTLARCGDGFTRDFVETCDIAVADQADFCNALCLWATCPDADGNGKTAAIDGLFILSAAVGTAPHCPRVACDVNRDGDITAADALSALRMAVGLEAPDVCGRYGDGDSVTFRLESSGILGALQWEAAYDGDIDRFRNSVGGMQCESLVPELLFAANGLPGKLTFGLISVSGFSGPLDLVRCRSFPLAETPPGVTVKTAEASDLDFLPILPLPTITARID